MRSRLWRSVRTAAAVLTGLVAAALAAGFTYEEVGRRRDRDRLPRVGDAVDIGGRRLNVFCSGTGQPAVVILTGNTQPGYAWSHIQPEIATYARACWFDRAGEGWSDPGPYPLTSAATMRDLHRALRRAKVAPPYVLVGHSRGGLEARVYTGLYPAEVAGLVLADPAHEAEPRLAPPSHLGRTVPAAWRHPVALLLSAAARFGVIRLLTPAAELPTDPARRTREQIVRALAGQPSAVAATEAFGVVLPESYDQAERSGTLGDRPLVVLTAGKPPEHPPRDDMERQDAAYEQVWTHEIMAGLARSSTQGRQMIVEQSGHMIPDEAPAAVLEAVRSVVASVRGRPVPLAAAERRQ